MSANAAAVNPAIAAATAAVRPPAVETRQPATAEERFDRQLDAARQQQDQAHSTHPAHAKTHDAETAAHASHAPAPAPARSPAKAPAATDIAKAPAKPVAAKQSATATDEHDQDQPADPVALAAAVLALIGQAAPPAPPPPPLLANAPRMAGPLAAAATGTAPLDPAGMLSLAGTGTADNPISDAKAITAGPISEAGFAALLPLQARKDDSAAASQAAGAQTAALANLPMAPLAGPVHALAIASPVGTPAFAQELGQHIAWLGTQDIKQARIRLHPEELGALDVKVSVVHDRVDVSFAVQHPAAVHALQQTLPQLDTLLAHHGLALGHTDVGQRGQHDETRQGGGPSFAGDADSEPAAIAPPSVAALGLLDTFA